MLSPEARLVFRTAAADVKADEWRQLVEGVRDWERVFRLADRQVAAMALWRVLKEIPGVTTAVPQDFAEALRRVALVEDLRMQQLARRAQLTVEALNAAKVPVMLLKGAAIGALSDPSFRSRPMTDVDVLVAADNVEQAASAITSAGWSLTENPLLLELLKDAHHLPHFVDPSQPGVRLELHVSLMPHDQPFGITDESFWAAACPAPVPFAGAAVPSPAHMMLHATVHFAWQHMLMFGAWRTFRIVQLVSQLPAFDWEQATTTARAAKAGTTMYWTLRLAQTMCGIEVPAKVMAAVAPPTPERIRGALERHYVALNAPGEGPPIPADKLTRWLWWAALRPKWSGHSDPGRYDPERRWEHALGKVSTETAGQRYWRHLRNAGAWVRFARKTLLG